MLHIPVILLLIASIVSSADSNGNGTTGNNGKGNNGDGVTGSTGNTGNAGNNGNGDGSNGNNGNNGNTTTGWTVPTIITDWTSITINSTNGKDSTDVSIGVVKAGSVLSFQYVSGGWTAYPPSKEKNPDVKENNADLNCPTPSVCIRKDGKNVEIGRIGTNTSASPWSITVVEGGEIVVNMNSDSKFKNNVGSVIYKYNIK